MKQPTDPAARPILVAVDFSPSSERALLWAAHAAKCLGVPLVALHVVHDPESAPGYYQRSRKRNKHLKRIEEAAAEMMAELVDRMAAEHPDLLGELDHRLVVGLPVTRVLEVGSEIDAQMIVVGSHGRTGLSHLLLGSKAEKIAQLAPVPVTIVKDGARWRDRPRYPSPRPLD